MPPKSPPSYVKTKLPVLLDLQNRNTREQIETGNSRMPAWSGASQGGGNNNQVALESKDECQRIMVDSCVDFLGKKGLWQPNSSTNQSQISREEDVKFFWEWLREFHSEYGEEWFTRNMPRLKAEFQPIWSKTVKASKNAGSGGSGNIQANNNVQSTTEPDLLNLGLQDSSNVIQTSQSQIQNQAVSGGDLLDLAGSDNLNQQGPVKMINSDPLADLLSSGPGTDSGPGQPNSGNNLNDLLGLDITTDPKSAKTQSQNPPVTDDFASLLGPNGPGGLGTGPNNESAKSPSVINDLAGLSLSAAEPSLPGPNSNSNTGTDLMAALGGPQIPGPGGQPPPPPPLGSSSEKPGPVDPFAGLF